MLLGNHYAPFFVSSYVSKHDSEPPVATSMALSRVENPTIQAPNELIVSGVRITTSALCTRNLTIIARGRYNLVPNYYEEALPAPGECRREFK